MNELSSNLYDKIVKLAEKVKQDLRQQGIIIPIDNEDGSIQIGSYTIFKNDKGFYYIKCSSGDIIVNDINLPQTAIIIANELNIKKFFDKDILYSDREYGFSSFEEVLYKHLSANTKTLDRYEFFLNKHTISKDRKESIKKNIDKRFEKLKKIA